MLHYHGITFMLYFEQILKYTREPIFFIKHQDINCHMHCFSPRSQIQKLREVQVGASEQKTYETEKMSSCVYVEHCSTRTSCCFLFASARSLSLFLLAWCPVLLLKLQTVAVLGPGKHI